MRQCSFALEWALSSMLALVENLFVMETKKWMFQKSPSLLMSSHYADERTLERCLQSHWKRNLIGSEWNELIDYRNPVNRSKRNFETKSFNRESLLEWLFKNAFRSRVLSKIWFKNERHNCRRIRWTSSNRLLEKWVSFANASSYPGNLLSRLEALNTSRLSVKALSEDCSRRIWFG